MSVVVTNQLHFDVPVETLVADIDHEFRAAFAGCSGFERFYLVQTAPDRATAVIVWATAEDAQAGAAVIGPSVFATLIAPHLASEQDRAVGPVVVSIDS
ncbi:MAG: hypothetical protein DWI48_05680 [Chloroflexi bacterium]|nr:MAG: hypothetical protein DWI48_05680 [Chloroflexota bacterium]